MNEWVEATIHVTETVVYSVIGEYIEPVMQRGPFIHKVVAHGHTRPMCSMAVFRDDKSTAFHGLECPIIRDNCTS